MPISNQKDLFDALDEISEDGYQDLNPGAPSPTNYSEYISAVYPGREIVPLETLEAALETKRAREAEAEAKAAARASLRQWWEGEQVEPWIRGPFSMQFEAAATLLDKGDVEGAAALIEFAVTPPSYTQAQSDRFDEVKAEIVTRFSAIVGV